MEHILEYAGYYKDDAAAKEEFIRCCKVNAAYKAKNLLAEYNIQLDDDEIYDLARDAYTNNYVYVLMMLLLNFNCIKDIVISFLVWLTSKKVDDDNIERFLEVFDHYKDKIDMAAYSNVLLMSALKLQQDAYVKILLNADEIYDKLGLIDIDLVMGNEELKQAAMRKLGLSTEEELREIIPFLS